MTLVPHRTAVAQVAAQLEQALREGQWSEWLPNERDLAQELQVSRSTLRFALAQLRLGGVIESRHGVGNRIVRPTRALPRTQKRWIALLAPAPLGQLRPSITLWIDELKDLLHAAECELRVYCVRAAYQSEPTRALQRLCRSVAPAGWILVLSTEPMQRWFLQHGPPCVIAGSLHAGVDLPSVDLDYRSIARHAAGTLLRAGHRKITLVNRRLRGAGEIETETGFLEAAHASPHAGVDAGIVHYDEKLDSLIAALNRLLEQATPPTGLLIANSNFYLAVVTELARRGIRIPQDMSLISRDDDPFLNFVIPAPARYLNAPQVFATKLRTLALHLLERGSAPVRRVRIEPRFEPGGSVALRR